MFQRSIHSQLLFEADGKGTGAPVEEIVYEEYSSLENQEEVTDTTMRAPLKPICPASELAVIENFKLEEIRDIIAGHIDSHDEDTYQDRKNPKRKLINLYLTDPKAPAFYNSNGTPNKYHARISDPAYREVTIEQLIVDQFAHLTYIAKYMDNAENGKGHQAEFIKYQFPIAGGIAKVRTFAYNPGGFIVTEFRGYKKVVLTGIGYGPARAHVDKTHSYGTGLASGARVSATPAVVKSNRVAGAGNEPIKTLQPTQPVNQNRNDLGSRRQPGAR